MSGKNEEEAVKVSVPSTDADKKGGPKKKEKEASGPSEEDLRIQGEVDLLLTRAADANQNLVATALETLSTMLRTQGGTVASIPKPLKYVRKQFTRLEQIASQETSMNPENARRLRDIMSFVAMTIDRKLLQESSLTHKLKGNRSELGQWGHEYLRFLAGELAAEWEVRSAATAADDAPPSASTAELRPLIDDIVQYMVHHQDESSAIDLLMEIGDVAAVASFVDDANLHRIAMYLVAVGSYVTAPTNKDVLSVAYNLYKNHNAFPQALRVALQLRDRELALALFNACSDPSVKLQMAFVCARARVFFDFDDDENLSNVISNRKLVELYRFAAKELDSLAPKTPDEIFKTQMDSRAGAQSHVQNLASLMVSGMSNCGFGKDTMLSQEGSTAIYQTKEHRMMSATAALGWVHLWDEGDGLAAVDKYTYSDDSNIKAGAYLATGLCMCGVRSSFDAAFGLLSEHVNSTNRDERIGAILGLGYAHAGTFRDDVKELLVPILANSESPVDVQCFAAFAAALVFPGSCDEDLVETCISCLMEKDDSVLLSEPSIRYLIFAIGAFFLGRADRAEALFDATQALSPVIRKYADVVVRSCAFAGSGNVVEAQRLFHLIADQEDDDDETPTSSSSAPANDAAASESNTAEPAADAAAAVASTIADEESASAAAATGVTAASADKPSALNHKAAAVLGIAMVALGEDLGTEMAKRSLIHVLLADTVSKKDASMSGRRAVPLAYALLATSTANMPTAELLNRLSHDGDSATAINAVLSMGLVGAGTTNARVATMLRQLAQYYHKEKDSGVLFMVRMAQGLVSLGKGHVTLSPLQQDGAVLNTVSLVGLLGLLYSALDAKATLLDKHHHMFFSITPAINARSIIAVDGQLNPIASGVTVRVGQPVDIVTVAGKPKSITGFQTHGAPVLLGTGDRAELAPGKYRSLGAVVEGVIIVEEKQITADA